MNNNTSKRWLCSITLLLVCFFWLAIGEAVQAQPAGYTYYKTVTINAAQVQGTHSNFPVLISVTDNNLRTVANGGQVTNANGYDIVFTNSDGSQVLSHQIERYTATSGNFIVWVSVPSISSSGNTTLRMYYGNGSVSANPSTDAIWSSTPYTSVYHLTDTFTDATATNNDGTNNGTSNNTGKIAQARSFNGSSNYIQLSQDLSSVIGGNATVSAWIRTNATGSDTPWSAPGLTGIEESGGGNDIFYGYVTANGRIASASGNGASAISTSTITGNQWYYVVFTRNSTSGAIQVFINGTLQTTVNSETGIKNNPFYSIGRIEDTGGSPMYFNGRIDEFRISNQIISANEIATTYNNQNTPSSFYTVGSQQLADASPPSAPQNVAATALGGSVIQISFDDVDETGSGVASYSIKRSTTSGSGYTQIGTVTDNESASYTFTDNTATNGTTYYYVVSAIDGAGNESTNSAQVSATADGTAPVLESATVNGTSLVLDYNENLKTSPLPATNNFTVLVDGAQVTVTGIAIVNDKVQLTLASGAEQGDVVTISYTAGANPIQDAAGNNAADLSGQAVSNNTLNSLPTPPIELQANAVAGGAIDIVFEDVNAPVTINSYNIKRSASQGGPYTTIGTVTDNESVTYTYTDNTVTNGSTYYYIITSVDQNAQESVESDEITATADATAPVLQLISANGEFVVLEYNESMDTNPLPTLGDFTVTVNGGTPTVNSLSVSGSRVIFSLDPEVVAGDNVQIAYNPQTNPLQDAAGNDAPSFSTQNATNNTWSNATFGPDPCPISNNYDAAWACFSGTFGGTSLTANVGGLDIATVTAVGANATFAPNALQQWASGAFSGDQFNGPQVNPTGASGDATSLNINIPANIPSDALILSLNRLRPNAGGTSYALEAFDGSNNKVTVNDWITGQGTDGGVCTNSVTLNYTNGNTTVEFQPVVSGNPSCASSSTPVWFRITDNNVRRIELRKVAANSDNIHIGLAVVADFGDAANTYGTLYSGLGTPPALHRLNNSNPNTVYFGSGVDGDGNGAPSAAANLDSDDGRAPLIPLNSAQTSYQTTLSCTTNGYVGAWIDFDLSGTFDVDEYASAQCTTGSVTLTWTGLTGLVEGESTARFRIASAASEVSNPVGAAVDGEVEDYPISIIEPPTPDLELTKTVDNSSPVEGDNVNFTLTVTNPGEFDANGIRVTDQLPSGLIFVSANPSQGTFNSSTGIWNIGTIEKGDSTSVTLILTAKVDDGTLGNTIENQASITRLTETDPELNNNSATAGITVVPEQADIAIAMSVSNASPIEGEFIDYTISVTNNGPKTAENLSVLSQIPSVLTYIDSTVTAGTYNPNSGLWTIGTLVAGNTVTLVVQARVNGDTEGSNISYSSTLNNMDQVDPVVANNTATSQVTVAIPTTNLSCGSNYPRFVNRSLLSGSDLQVGAKYRYESVLPGVYAEVEILTINNVVLNNLDAPGTQSGVGSDDEFAPYVNNNNAGDGYVDFQISFFDSANGFSKYLTFSATSGDVDGTGDLRDYVGFQNLNSFVVENTTKLIPGSQGIYATFISSDFNNTVPGNADFTNYKVYTTYTNETTFRLRAGIDANQTQGNRIISLNFDPCELNTFSNPVTNPVVDIAVLKTVDDNSVTTGRQITYTVTAQNKKAASASGIQLTDQLPAGLTFNSSNPSQGSYNSTNGIWTVGTLNGLQSATLELTATVNNGTEGNTISNTATLTGVTGTDGLATNNSATANILVFDPGSGMSCSEPPLFSFLNYTLEQGNQNQVNSIYRYTNVAPGIDAIVKILNITNATINTFDDDGSNSGGQATASNFSPLFTTNNGTSDGYIDYNITFVQTGTNIPVRKDFSVTATDIDGTNSGNGVTIRDFYGFAENSSSITQAGNNLESTFLMGDFEIFRSAVTQDANGSFDIDHIAYIQYKYTSTFNVRAGSTPTGGYPNQRLVEFNFTPCLNQEFTNPVVNTRNADLAIVKTVDEANPLENTNINFTISLTNNGGEKATEVVVSEALPAGLTLVEATPSQGTYNQITKLWNVGTLPNGANATLSIEAGVDAGVTADSLINKTFVSGFNQFDPNVNNDTSQVVIKIGVELKGTVFKDITGNGVSEDMTFNDASGDQQAVKNVEVHLFRDGGDGLADGADDVYLQTKTSGNLGGYTFKIGDDADYWVVVDSKTGDLSNGNYWAEQTYAPAGGLCEDGTGNTQVLSTAGNCFGGRRGNVSDNISTTPVAADLVNAEHVAKVTIAGTGISGINFGYSFNVVTNTKDTDDDATANRSAQGSLRQFITNANEITGANTMRFVPAVPTNATGSGGNWWSVTINSELPALTDALTTINGIAYQNDSPKTTRNDNPGTVGTGGSVGLDNLTAATFEAKEFEINLNDMGNNAFVVNASGAYTIRNIAVYNNTVGIRVNAGSGGLLEKNMVGTRADGTDAGGSNRIDVGVLFDGLSAVNPLIQQNYIAYLNDSGVKSTNQSASITVFNNEIYQAAQTSSTGDGVEGIGVWVIRQNRIHGVGNGSSSVNNGGNGIELGASTGSSSGNTIRNNTIYNNAVTGVTATNGVSNTLIEKNIIYQNGTNYLSSTPKYGAGVKLTTPSGSSQQGIRITRNSFYSNYGISIDQVTSGSGAADGVSPNDGTLVAATSTPNRGLDYPQFNLATLENGVLVVEGFVGTAASKLQQTYTIEIYKAEDDGDSDALIEVGGALTRPHGEGRYLIGTLTTTSTGSFTGSLSIPSGVSLAFNDRITAIAISAANNTSEFSANQRVVPTGVTISGYVYHDVNHNQNKDGVELGLQDVTIVLYNRQENNCKSVLTNSEGYYVFNNILNGSYDLIEAFGQSVPTPDVCTPATNDPDDYISTTPNLRTVTVNNLPAIQHFGDFEGSKITGKVFNDNGVSGGVANDGIFNGVELGLSSIVVKALTGSDVLIEQTNSGADGSYSLYVPKSVVPTGGSVKIQETNATEFLSTGGEVGTTSGSYTISTDVFQFTNTVGTTYTGVNFADVRVPSLLTDGAKTVQPGAVSLFTHQFIPNTSGDVVFTMTSVNNPNINFPKVLNHDLNCNGELDSGEPILTGTSTVSVTTGETVCLIVRVTVPNGVQDGGNSTTTITATFDLANSPTNIQRVLNRMDIVTVSTQDGGFVIIKAVDKAQALPGDTLTYTIEYENLGDEPISQIEVVDEVPIYTTYQSSSCGTLPSGVTNCTITAPSIGVRGTIRWVFIGVLQPGENGTVSYKVLIDN